MYATVRTYSETPELADALVNRADDVKRIISEIDGFRAYYLIRTGDGAVSVSVYDSESGVEESSRVAAAWIRENLPDFAGSPPRVSAGEVVIDA
jgi:heme-degrading monooxygenase HmoA